MLVALNNNITVYLKLELCIYILCELCNTYEYHRNTLCKCILIHFLNLTHLSLWKLRDGLKLTMQMPLFYNVLQLYCVLHTVNSLLYFASCIQFSTTTYMQYTPCIYHFICICQSNFSLMSYTSLWDFYPLTLTNGKQKH